MLHRATRAPRCAEGKSAPPSSPPLLPGVPSPGQLSGFATKARWGGEGRERRPRGYGHLGVSDHLLAHCTPPPARSVWVDITQAQAGLVAPAIAAQRRPATAGCTAEMHRTSAADDVRKLVGLSSPCAVQSPHGEAGCGIGVSRCASARRLDAASLPPPLPLQPPTAAAMSHVPAIHSPRCRQQASDSEAAASGRALASELQPVCFASLCSQCRGTSFLSLCA